MFSGIGGFELAIKNQMPEWECVGFSEIDKSAVQVYREHFLSHKNYGDARAIDLSQLPSFDLLTFGWPCQDNSLAGKRKGQRSGTRSGLLHEALRILNGKKPRYFIAENVPGLFSVNEGLDFYETIGLFADAGYDVQWQVLNTAWFLPQTRERIYFVGHLGGTSRPEIFPIGEGDEGIIKETENGIQTSGCILSTYYKGGVGAGHALLKQIVGSETRGYRVYDLSGTSVSISSQGGGWGAKTGLYAIPILNVQRKEGRQNGRRFKTNTATDQHGIFDGYRIRRLTPLECERLQGFPDGWTKSLSDTQRYKCIGNAVSVPVVEAIIKRLSQQVFDFNSKG